MGNILYRADCKGAIRKLILEGVKVDLIYLDPPFNSSRIYNMIYRKTGVTAQQKAFHDMWDASQQIRQLTMEFQEIIKSTKWASESAKLFLSAFVSSLSSGNSQDTKTLKYLIYMTERLALLREILSEEGCIYFHCDPTASHYIKIVMDGIFGSENFRNEIVWKRTNSPKSQSSTWGWQHDVILMYSKGKKVHFRQLFKPKTDKYLQAFSYDDNDGKGRYQTVALVAGGSQRSENRKEFEFLGIKQKWLYSLENLKAFEQDGRIYHTKNGTIRLKSYLSEAKGVSVSDIWVDDGIPPMQGSSAEYEGYQTQKPVELVDRIIKASCPKSKENGCKPIVLDPFCGCGTTIEAAIRNDVDWIGIDISWDAIEIMKKRINDQPFGSNKKYDFRDSDPQTREEYDKMSPLEKQDWLIRRLRGIPNERKSGDRGVDGEVTIHLGCDENDKDIWGKAIFSVKTGNQRNPELVRELVGTMKLQGAKMGILILDKDPTIGMEREASNRGSFDYSFKKNMPPKSIDKVQIITSQEILDNDDIDIDLPPTLTEVKIHRGNMGQMQF